jgi:6-phosphogluconolactonase
MLGAISSTFQEVKMLLKIWNVTKDSRMEASKLSIVVEENKEALSEMGARLFEKQAIGAIEKDGRFLVALSGGSTPREMHKRLAFRSSIPWQYVHVFWGDERCLPVADPSSNYGAAQADFLGKVPLPAGRIHPMPAQGNPQHGALMYEKELGRVFNLRHAQLPVFDLVFLGLGKDGHAASLFPGHEALQENKRLVVAVRGGEPEVYRLTLTLPVLNWAREVMFLVSGRDKAEVVKAVIEAQEERLPASKVRPSNGHLTWLLDREAASLLSRKTLSSF